MITISLGNVGSGKTATAVAMMKENPHKIFITNIDTKGKDFKHVFKLKSENIITKEVVSTKKDGSQTFKLSLNIDFWKELIKKHSAVNVVIDEAHIFFNPRRSMSKLNIIMTDFLALLRRVLGSADGSGELLLITQLSRRVDVIAKEMATNVTYCIHHFTMTCSKCNATWKETNETADKKYFCPRCGGYHIKRSESLIEVLKFINMDSYDRWFIYRQKTYYKRFIITNIKEIFGNYETLQFNDLFSEY